MRSGDEEVGIAVKILTGGGVVYQPPICLGYR